MPIFVKLAVASEIASQCCYLTKKKNLLSSLTRKQILNYDSTEHFIRMTKILLNISQL